MNEEERLKRLIADYGDDVLKCAFVYLNDRGLAEDAYQEVFAKAFMSLGKFRGESSEKTWLLRITINHCKNVLKSRAYRNLRLEGPLTEREEAAPDASFENDSDIWEAIDRLSRSDRAVIVLRYFKDYGSAEAAGILGISEAALRSRLSRALKKLNKYLTERDGLYEDKRRTAQSLHPETGGTDSR